jgi:hypothetical protein
MNDDSNQRSLDGSIVSDQPINRRRDILKRIGQASAVAGVAASPVTALAGSARKWCKNPVDQTKCVHASISGMGSVVMSAEASNEVMSRKCSHYASYSNWPASCSNGSQSIICNQSNDNNNTKFCVAFNCTSTSAQDSQGRPRYIGSTLNSACLLNKSLSTLCSSYSSTPEAHWATALGNANKLAVPVQGAPFPYTPAQVVSYYSDAVMASSAYTFFSTYCEQYA